uniref:BEACH-type PH domain-containing protein n=1 Tax=Panagrellus redivivus TaxID=6233 RepID=A0A7E4V5F5_PANRE
MSEPAVDADSGPATHATDRSSTPEAATVRAESPGALSESERPAIVTASPTIDSISSEVQSVKSPDFDEHDLEDIQLNDQSMDGDIDTYSSLPKYEPNPAESGSSNEEDYEPTATPQGEPADESGSKTTLARPTVIAENGLETLPGSHSNDQTPEATEGTPSEAGLPIENTTVLHASDESVEETFKRLQEGLTKSTLSHKDIVNGLFNVLVGGSFDLESRFIIESSSNIEKMLDLLEVAPLSMQAEIWSLFVAIVRKSFRNLEACSRVGLISICLDKLPDADPVVSDLLVELLSVLTNYSITVKETKHFLRALRVSNKVWHRNSVKLLSVMQEMPKRDGADVFFSFPGKAGAGISLPPIAKWPYQHGWTFSTWLRMDPLNSVNFEKERPYLFNFVTQKGVGYQCYFMGSCLVLNCLRGPGKEVIKCVRQELTPRKWHHVALSFVYARWARSEIHCFIDGQLVETIDATWLANTNDTFDRCNIGCGTDNDPNQAFCGQMGAVYVFSQAITAQQANCLYCLGATYQSYFKHDAESDLPDSYKKQLFDAKLNQSLVFAYCPKNCHGQLCLFPTIKTANTFFVQVPHAIMKDGVEVIATHSIHNSLHSVGGIQMLLPLFAQIDLPHRDREPPIDHNICSNLLSVISLLLKTSPSAQQQLFHSQGFLIIAHVLKHASREHLTHNVLEAFIDISKYLLTCTTGIPLLKQLFDHILFNPTLWIRAEDSIQVRLYTYLAEEFLANASLLAIIRRTSTVVELMHTLKVHYFVVEPRPPSTYTVRNVEDHNLISKDALTEIRRNILLLVEKLMFLKAANQDDKEINREDEFQCLFNFLATVNEEENLIDVLKRIVSFMHTHPAIMVPSFDKRKGSSVIFKLLGCANEEVRIPALKIFGYFVCRSTTKRKNDSVNNKNLLSLLSDRLLSNCKTITPATYYVLFEILIEVIPDEEDTPERILPADARFENSTLLKVIANLLTQLENSPVVMDVKKLFLEDMIRYCKDSRENRRIILQMSVWQEWLISLAYVFPESPQETEITDLVYQLFAILLFHAIRIEYAGWRVWVDTLAIAHSKVSWEKYRRKLKLEKARKVAAIEEAEAQGETIEGGQETPSSIYRTPEFVWSDMHVRLLSDLLNGIEEVTNEWNNSNIAVVDHVNNTDNSIFISNTVHVMSQLTDSLIMACGGLLPLLAAATSPNSELEITDSTQQGLSVENAVNFLTRFVRLADVFIFISTISFSELEHEKNMPNGGILRQSLRLVSTMAVRNILACRFAQKDRLFSNIPNKKNEAIFKFINGAMDDKDPLKGIVNVDRLLQEVDLQRLKGVVYRDMEENRQAQFLALSVVYLLCVLMVSRYRDILEPPTSPSPFFDTNSNSSANKKSLSGNSSASNKNSPAISSSSTFGDSPTIGPGGDGGEPSPEHDQVTYIDKPPKGETTEEAGESVPNGKHPSADNENEEESDEEKHRGISSIKFTQEDNVTAPDSEGNYDANELNRFAAASNLPKMRTDSQYLTSKLQTAIETVAPLLREIIADFKSYLQKTLLGTHSQEIMNDVRVMQTLKNPQGSVIELVMLLCSQEWQTSLQRHAGLAFIELVNEGRLMAHATRDHVLRVANEADFILNRLRAEDVSKHAAFDHDSLDQLNARKQEEQVSDHLIVSSRRRDQLTAAKSLEKMRTILMSPSGAWCNNDKEDQAFWKLDLWEDDSRRRKRFVPNVYGCRQTLASLTEKPATDENAEELEKAQEQLLKDLSHKMLISQPKPNVAITDIVDESDIDKWALEDAELRDVRQDRTSYSTPGKLIAPGVVVPGTISITASDVYFDADEDDPLYKEQDVKFGAASLGAPCERRPLLLVFCCQQWQLEEGIRPPLFIERENAF